MCVFKSPTETTHAQTSSLPSQTRRLKTTYEEARRVAAVERGRGGILDQRMVAGANREEEDSNRWRARIVAVWFGCANCAKKLLEAICTNQVLSRF